MIETAFDYLHMGCLSVFLVEHLHLTVLYKQFKVDMT